MFDKIKKNAQIMGNTGSETRLPPNAKALMDEQLPKVQALFKEQVGIVSSEVIQNDARMTRSFEIVYKLLPLPFRLVVKKEPFVLFCLQNRNRIVSD